MKREREGGREQSGRLKTLVLRGNVAIKPPNVKGKTDDEQLDSDSFLPSLCAQFQNQTIIIKRCRCKNTSVYM